MLLLHFLLLAATLRAEFAGELFSTHFDHVVVIPDTHGDFHATIRSLWLAHKKISGTAHPFTKFGTAFKDAVVRSRTREKKYFGDLAIPGPDRVAVVQLGDLVDRGPYGDLCLEIFKVLPHLLGWRTINLYGNHEIMSFLGLSEPYVTYQEEMLFGNIQKRNKQYAPGGELFKYFSSSLVGLARLKGPVEYALDDPRNPNTLFVHGGIDMSWIRSCFGESASRASPQALEEVNKRIAEFVMDPSYEGMLKLCENNSILWTRTMAEEPETKICQLVTEALQHFGVARIVVGHTPQEDMIAKVRCGGKFILADVQMSRWMSGFPVDESDPSGGNPVAIIMKLSEVDHKLESIKAYYTDIESGGSETTTLLFDSAPRAPEALGTIQLKRSSKTSSSRNLFAIAPAPQEPSSLAALGGGDENTPPKVTERDSTAGFVGQKIILEDEAQEQRRTPTTKCLAQRNKSRWLPRLTVKPRCIMC